MLEETAQMRYLSPWIQSAMERSDAYSLYLYVDERVGGAYFEIFYIDNRM